MCGLMGFYPKKGKKCDIVKMSALAALNEIRGTDSCGVACGSNRLIGVKGDKSIARYFIAEEYKNIAKLIGVNKPLIFHTRKSTFGVHNEENAHPFYWTIGSKPKDYFVFAHNGTLENHYELINTYGQGRNRSIIHIDSHVLGLAMFEACRGEGISEEDVVTKYKGYAAFICYDDEQFKVWKGGANDVEERPMYMLETPDGWYFHSQNFALWSVFGKLGTALENNQLLTFTDHKLKSKVIYKREFKKEPIIIKNNTHSNNYTPPNRKAHLENPNISDTSILKDLIGLDGIFNREIKKTTSKSNGEYFKNVMLNTDFKSLTNMKYVWKDAPNVELRGEIPLGLSNKHYKTFLSKEVADDGAKKIIKFSDGYCVEDIVKHIELKTLFNRFTAQHVEHVLPPYNEFVKQNQKLISEVLVDFLILDYKIEWDSNVLVLYYDSNGVIDYLDNLSNKSVRIKNIFDEDVTISTVKYSEDIEGKIVEKF